MRNQQTYFIKYQVEPTSANLHFEDVDGAYATCWIIESNPQTAISKSKFYISKFDWDIKKIEILPTEVCEEDFAQRDIGLEQFRKAQKDGIAIVYAAWSRDGKSTEGPFVQKPSYDFDVNLFLSKQKKFNKYRRCLHYDSGESCNQVINAHSIQRKGSLAAIEEGGHVYVVSKNISDLKENNGKAVLKKEGITTQVSTFLGFCQYHDNALFEKIDNYPLIPTDEQILLYAYRSICKELFVKENSYNLMKSQFEQPKLNQALIDLFESMVVGTKIGLDNLKREKQRYDLTLRNRNFQDIKYVLFLSEQKPNLVFSGLFFPEYDFTGRLLQDISDVNNQPDLLTFCSANTKLGWGFLFAWHVNSSKSCSEFTKSLATMAHENYTLEEFMFRLVISNCENFAVSPSWWESLPENDRGAIEGRISNMADIFSLTQPNYLSEGLSGICPWKFENVISNME